MLSLRARSCFFILTVTLASNRLGQSVNPGWVSLQEGQSIDGYTRKDNRIYCGGVRCGAPAMAGVDASTFKVWPGSKYAKDKANVYYPLSIVCRDGATCGACFCDEYVIRDLSVNDFDYLGKDYATDGIKVFFRGEELAGADGKSFKVIDGPAFFYFAVDKSNVYEHNSVFTGADPSTFYYDPLDKRNDEVINHSVIADKRHKWLFIPPDGIKRLR
jgi:hypothetical protein